MVPHTWLRSVSRLHEIRGNAVRDGGVCEFHVDGVADVVPENGEVSGWVKGVSGDGGASGIKTAARLPRWTGVTKSSLFQKSRGVHVPAMCGAVHKHQAVGRLQVLGGARAIGAALVERV